jgi:hypothetical protein
MARKRISVTQESTSGRNERFRDNYSGATMSRAEFVRRIERGDYSRFHVRVVNGVRTPASNPDGSPHNNLG